MFSRCVKGLPPLRCGILFGMAEDAALVVLVVQLRAIRTFSVSGQQKYFAGRKHTQGRRHEIDPQACQ